MAFLGNSDSTGSGQGTSFFSLATDITNMGAGSMASIKLGTYAQAKDSGKTYVLINTAGTLSWQIID